MMQERVVLQFCGLGGQGVILAATVFGSAAVLGKGLYAVQTQSFGSEARGAECQAELILSTEPVGSPVSSYIDYLTAMSETALARYLHRLRTGGALLINADMVVRPARDDITQYAIPATQLALEVGAAIAANMVILGHLQKISRLVEPEHLVDAIRENVPERYLEANLLALERGLQWGSTPPQASEASNAIA